MGSPGAYICAHDGTALVEIGIEISEQLDIVPQQVRVVQHQRVKKSCPCCDQGNTLAASLIRVGEAVRPIINLLRDHLLEADLVHADETTIQVLKEPGKKAQTKNYLWAQATGGGPPIRLFGYASGRLSHQAGLLYAGIRRGAALMSDGYEVYGGIAEANGLTHLACWAHCRRYFVEAEAVIPKAARSPEQIATQFAAPLANCMPSSRMRVNSTRRRAECCARNTAVLSCNGSKRCCSSICTRSFLAACWSRRCIICSLPDFSRNLTLRRS